MCLLFIYPRAPNLIGLRSAGKFGVETDAGVFDDIPSRLSTHAGVAQSGVVAPLWLRANAPMVVAEVCSTMKYPKRCQYKHAKQKKYHVRNWAEYNEGLRRRGDLTVWFDEEAIANCPAEFERRMMTSPA